MHDYADFPAYTYEPAICFQIMEEKMSFYSKMLDKIQSFVTSSKGLIENVQLAAQKVGEMASVVGDAVKALKNYAIKNLFYLHHLCIAATLEHAGKGKYILLFLGAIQN